MNLQKIDKILLFGKSRAFSKDEFLSQMKYHKIDILENFDATVSLIIEGRMLTPYEQNSMDALYETQTTQIISIDILEAQLAKELDEDTLLMSLTLSRDTERLKSFIQNNCISDTLFFRLIQMYKWKKEDFFENDDNRDVSAAFIARFYENIQRNHNVQYATTGFIHLVAQTKNTKLLDVIASLEPLTFHPKITTAIAMSPYCDETLQKKLYKKQSEKIEEALSLNENLSVSLVEKFLTDEPLGNNIAQSIALDKELFVLLRVYSKSLAKNESLSLEMQEVLLALKNPDVNVLLATNKCLHQKLIHTLFEETNEAIQQAIFTNSATAVEILEKAYKDEKNHEALAKNESTPIEILYQLQLDSRYERFVKTNAGYGKHIQTENIGWLV